MTLRDDDDALAFVRGRLELYERTGDRGAVLGPGVLPRAGRLWRAFLSPDGTSVEAAHALAWLHWSRHGALGADAPIDELWGALLLFARIGGTDPGLIPDEARRLLAGGPLIDHSFLGPEHWGRRAIQLLKSAQVADEDGRLLDEAVELFSGTTEAYSQEHRFWAGDMANLSLALRMRYEQRGDPADLETSERTARTALRAVDPGDPHLPSLLNNLSTALVSRSSRTGDAVAVTEAIRLLSRALRTAPPPDPNRRMLEENRAAARMRRFDLTGDRDELDRAVGELKRLVADTPDGDATLGKRRGLLGGALHKLYGLTRDPQQLHEAVESLTKSVDSTPLNSIDRPAALSDLCAALLTRFDETGSPQDLDDALTVGESAVEKAQFDDPRRPARLHTWGQALLAAADHTRRPDLLDQAVDVFRQAVRTLPPGAPQAAAYSASLAEALMARQFGSLVDVTPFGVTELAAEAARRRLERFREEGDPATAPDPEELADLTDAHEAQLRAVERAGPHHPDRGMYLQGLSNTSYSHYVLFGRRQDADRALELSRQAVEATPPEHPGHGEAVHQLARLLVDIGDAEDAEDALSLWEGLVSLDSAQPSVLARAAGDAARARCRRGEWAAAAGHYARALQILPSLVSPARDRTAQERLLTYWSGLSAEAASCAIAAGQPDRALELLEQGRGVLWSRLLDARTDMSALEAVDPASAERLSRLERELNASPAAGSAERWWGRIADHRLTLAAERDELLARIRSLPGLSGFRRPAGARELRRAAADGPVVVIVSSQWSTDALIVTVDETRVVPLGGLDHGLDHPALLTRAHRYLTALAQYEEGPRDAVARVKLNLLITSTLEWLWRDIADPVLTALGHTGPPAGDRDLPRLWWCPTGPLALLPLHAAGLPASGGPADAGAAGPDGDASGGADAGCCVLDRVTPSYTPTLRALLASRGTGGDSPGGGAARPPERMLTVAMPTTPGHPPLPQVMDELGVLRGALPGSTVLQGDQATHTAVRDALRNHRWAHLSCHGGQDLLRPSQGGLVLHDAVLTVADLRADQHPHGEFVFLSACQTALGGAAVPDEAITMASALQYAGWRQVIGTLWSVGATTAVELSADLYGALVRDGDLHTEGAAEAVYRTVRRLRADGHAPVVWAPFAHSGI
ncbi:CHAT domain-containing protein [Streptomyces winkii]|uniref:CHAT domain-containing protein n=1 Tax=Streptomyces winkii TaxID=3051178 RepID=UPI0028D41A40|nr:CHAT domain-containing protein [Streptomyces sp. DSM 40971]